MQQEKTENSIYSRLCARVKSRLFSHPRASASEGLGQASMQTPPGSPSRPVVSGVQRYVFDPIDRIGYALIWSCATVCTTTGAFSFLLICALRILPHFARLWSLSFPTTVEDFAATPLGLLLGGTVFLCWANVYTVKHTRRAYRLLHVWIVSIQPNGERRIITLRHLTARLWPLQDQKASPSGAITVDVDGERTAGVVLEEERPRISGSRVPAKKNSLLRDARRLRFWTQRELADFAEVSLSTVERAERGEQIGIDSMRRLCTCLEKSPEQLGLRIKPTKTEESD